MEDKDKAYYVVLTGSKNNAGDFLIKHRAFKLFTELRPDRKIVDLNSWESFDEKTLSLVNNSKALVLLGGPALQKNMYPGIYPLSRRLSDIQVPITMMGVGWKSLSGNWADSRNYELSESTLELLSRIEKDSLFVSVRDYHTLNVLDSNSITKGVMTGCPATYDLDYVGSSTIEPTEVKNVGFSLGVSFLYSKSLKVQMENAILSTRKIFPNAKFEVVFHHGTTNEFLNTPSAKKDHLGGHQRFISWLKERDIEYTDISGSADNLVNYYSQCDVHIGYRVHAHIFMNSISKPSVLIAEDGRGKALRDVFGGLVLDAFDSVGMGVISKIFRRLKIFDTFSTSSNLVPELCKAIEYEYNYGLPRISTARNVIDSNYKVMKDFIKSLP